MRGSTPLLGPAKRNRDDLPTIHDELHRRYRCLTPPATGEAPGMATAKRLQKDDALFDVNYVVQQMADYHAVVNRARDWLRHYDLQAQPQDTTLVTSNDDASAAQVVATTSHDDIAATSLPIACAPSAGLSRGERDYIAGLLRHRLPPTTEAFNNRYRRLLKIGEGTYGDVFIVYDTVTKQHLAMKRLRNLLHDPNHSQLVAGVHVTIVQELKMLQVLDHKNVLKLVDFHFMELGVCVLLLPLITHDLGGVVKWWRRCHQEYGAIHRQGFPAEARRRVEDVALASREGRLPLSQVKCLLHQLLTAVTYLHEKGVWHRDLKMSNLMINHDGTLVVVDFGWSRFEPYPLVVARRLEHKAREKEKEVAKLRAHQAAPPHAVANTESTAEHAVLAALPSAQPLTPTSAPTSNASFSNMGSYVHVARASQPPTSPHQKHRSTRLEGPALTGPVGTVNYRAPEVLIGSPSSRYYDGAAVDLWAIGCIAYELVVGELLLPGRNLKDIDALHQLLSILGAPHDAKARLQWPQCSLISGTADAMMAISEAQQKQLSRSASSNSRDRGGEGSTTTNGGAYAVLKKTLSEVVRSEANEDDATSSFGFISQFLKWNPAQRTSAKRALEHPWLTRTEPVMCQPSELKLPSTNTYSFLTPSRR